MSTTVRIPANVLPDIREAVLSVMHDAAQNVSEPVTRPEHERRPEWFVKGREELEHLWAILDIIGWHETDELDGDEYGQTILDAAADHAELYPTWEEEADASDEWRAGRGEPPRKGEIFRRGAALREFVVSLEARLRETAN
jgi:hypothetical protein